MSDKSTALQKDFLDRVISNRTHVSLFLMSGVKLQGMILGSDDHTITLTTSSASETQLVYKHAIASICPGEGRGTYSRTNRA